MKTSLEKKEKEDILQLSMTVCIASLSDDKKKAVLVSDKLLTDQGLFPHQVNGDGKIFDISKDVKVMYSGGTDHAIAIIDKAKKNIGSKKLVSEIAEYINQKHLDHLQNILVAANLTPRGIKSIEEYYKSKDLNLDQIVKNNIDIALTGNILLPPVDFIVCGKDSDGLFKIYSLNTNPRIAPQLQNSGYTAIGSGANHAIFSIIHHSPEHKVSLPSEKIKDILLEAKQKAEKTPDVGKATDVVIME